MTTIEQEKTYAGITAPLDCPIYRANLERATIADCGICACTHCIQQSNESGKTCTLCNRFIRSHTFTDHATDSPEVFDALFRIKDKEIDRKESTIQEQLKTIEELQSQMELSWNQLQSCAQLCGEQDGEMKRIWENTIPQLQGRLAELEDQLENSVNCNNVLEDRVNQLQGYAQLCADQDAQLNHIWRNIIPKLQGHQVKMEGQLDESGSGTRLLEEERTGDNIAAPFDCPIYRANLERANIADCGICACTHCIQQCNESGKTCGLCYRFIRSHTFTDHATDSPEVFDALFRIKDKEIDRRGLIIQEQLKTIEELQNLPGQLMTAIVRLEEDVEKVEIYVQRCLEKDTELQNLHENIIPEKDKTIEEQKNDIIYLKGKEKELTELVESLQEENQDVKEKNKELNRKEKELTERVDSLQEKNQDVKEKNKELNRKEKELTELVESLQEEIKHVKEKNIELNDTLTKTEEEAVRLFENLGVYVQLYLEKDTELQYLNGNIIPEKDKLIEDQKNEIINLIGQMEISGKQLQDYEQLCTEQDAQLKHLRENTIPELEGRLAELEEVVATFRRETVTVAHFKALPGTSLYTAIQQLQHFYDREYRCRYDITDKLDELLQTRLEDVLTKLLNETSDIGDRLAQVIRTYVSLLEENSNLHRSIKTQECTINDMKTELRQTKASKLKMEQRNMSRAEE